MHVSEKSSTFVGMNDEMKLRLAYAEIARLKDEMATANRGQVDLIAHDQALRADFERQREEDRQFFKAQQDNMKEFYMQQMKEQAERHKEELKHLREENLENVKRIMQDGNLELSNNLAEQMMRHIKLNLKNCLNIGSEDSALDYAFMFSVIESCYMNKLSPECYIKELVSRLTAKPVCTVEKVALLPCFMQK